MYELIGLSQPGADPVCFRQSSTVKHVLCSSAPPGKC